MKVYFVPASERKKRDEKSEGGRKEIVRVTRVFLNFLFSYDNKNADNTNFLILSNHLNLIAVLF